MIHRISAFSFLSLASAFFLSATVFAQTPDPVDPSRYLPLEVGNAWEYTHTLTRPQTVQRPQDESELRYESYRIVSFDEGAEPPRYGLVFEERSDGSEVLDVQVFEVWFDPLTTSVEGGASPGVLQWLHCLGSDFDPAEPIEDGCWPFVTQTEVLLPDDPEVRNAKSLATYVYGIQVVEGIGAISAGGGCEPCGPFDDRDDWDLTYARVGGEEYGNAAYESNPTIRYVDQSATGGNNGTSWEHAFVFLQDALAAAQSGDELWVAAGTYRPDQGALVTVGDREASFEVSGGASLYGGFSGTESAPVERDWEAFRTILSGDLAADDALTISFDDPTRGDNSFHVVTIDRQEKSVGIDGFVIQSGNAIGAPISNRGGAVSVYGAATIRNTVFRWNTGLGGGALSIYLLYDDEVSIEYSEFVENEAKESGGAVWAGAGRLLFGHVVFRNNRGFSSGGGIRSAADVVFLDVTLEGNYARDGGGAYVAGNAWASIVNTRFVSNIASDLGGGLYLADGRPSKYASISNSLFDSNTGVVGGAIFNEYTTTDVINSNVVYNSASQMYGGIYHAVGNGSEMRVKNSILWGNLAAGLPSQYESMTVTSDNSSIQHSLVQGGIPDGLVDGGFNVFLDPLFSDPVGLDEVWGTLDDDFSLLVGSPAIDAGANGFLPSDSLDVDDDGVLNEPLPADLQRNVRVFDGGSGTATVDIGAYEYSAPAIVMAVEQRSTISEDRPELISVYPNPFRGATTIAFTLPGPSEPILDLYDVLGRRVRTIRNGLTEAGRHEIAIEANGLSPGVYFVRLAAGRFSATKPLTVLH